MPARIPARIAVTARAWSRGMEQNTVATNPAAKVPLSRAKTIGGPNCADTKPASEGPATRAV
jgi:hypothetical protein